jgi:hypothetical protein
MARKKKIPYVDLKIKKLGNKSLKKSEKTEIIEKKSRKNTIERIPLETIISDSNEFQTFNISPNLKIRTNVNAEPLEIDLANVPRNKDNANDNAYNSVKGGDYSPKDTYSTTQNKAYESVYPEVSNTGSINSNFSTSNFGASNTGLSNNSGYPGENNEKKREKQYESSIDDKAKEERKRTW